MFPVQKSVVGMLRIIVIGSRGAQKQILNALFIPSAETIRVDATTVAHAGKPILLLYSERLRTRREAESLCIGIG